MDLARGGMGGAARKRFIAAMLAVLLAGVSVLAHTFRQRVDAGAHWNRQVEPANAERIISEGSPILWPRKIFRSLKRCAKSGCRFCRTPIYSGRQRLLPRKPRFRSALAENPPLSSINYGQLGEVGRGIWS